MKRGLQGDLVSERFEISAQEVTSFCWYSGWKPDNAYLVLGCLVPCYSNHEYAVNIFVVFPSERTAPDARHSIGIRGCSTCAVLEGLK